jgi:hypothetical protein
MKYGLNKINTILFTQQVRWFGDKRIQFHLWDQRIKLHKQHCCGQRWNISHKLSHIFEYLL